jgi:hypothetical protein
LLADIAHLKGSGWLYGTALYHHYCLFLPIRGGSAEAASARERLVHPYYIILIDKSKDKILVTQQRTGICLVDEHPTRAA